MAISKTTWTHLFYQFIIMTLLFSGNGYEILLDRKIILFIACIPIVCYQLIVLACCMELMPLPPWLSFLELTSNDSNSKEINEKDSEICSSPVQAEILDSPSREIVFPEVPDIFPPIRRWEKSVMNLGATPKCYVRPQKSKSWMNLSDSRSSEGLSSQEGSLDTIASSTDSRVFPQFQTRNTKTNLKERAEKAKSWKSGISDTKSRRKPEFGKSYSLKDDGELSCDKKDEQEEPGLEKSFSFPFRQKRLQSWLEMKESSVGSPNKSPVVPYWESVGYNLAVKYEARRRQRAFLKPIQNFVSNEHSNSTKSTENVLESSSVYKPSSKKTPKSTSARMTKFKTGISNLMSKMKEIEDSNNSSNNKFSKSALFKLKNKISSPTKENKEIIAMPEFPQFLNNDRPLIFYPKYIPFEKERFESDVKKKMAELSEEQNNQ